MQNIGSVLCELVIMESVSGFLEKAELIGQLEVFEWDEVAAVAEVFAAAIEKQLGIQENSVGIQKVISVGADGLRQRIRIVRHGAAEGVDQEILDDLAVKVAQALRSKGVSKQGNLEGGGGKGDISAFEEIADFLTKKGGRPIRHPIQIIVGDRPRAELTGRFGAQPALDLVDDSLQEAEVVVDEIGFTSRRVKVFAVNNFCRTREALVMQYSEAALPELAAAMVSQCATKIGYAERLDAKGKKFVELLKVNHVTEREYSLT